MCYSVKKTHSTLARMQVTERKRKVTVRVGNLKTALLSFTSSPDYTQQLPPLYIPIPISWSCIATQIQSTFHNYLTFFRPRRSHQQTRSKKKQQNVLLRLQDLYVVLVPNCGGDHHRSLVRIRCIQESVPLHPQ